MRAPAVRVMSLVFEDNHTNIYSKQKATKLRNLHNVSIVIFKTSNKIKWQSLIRNTSCLTEKVRNKCTTEDALHLHKVSIQKFNSTIIYSKNDSDAKRNRTYTCKRM